MHNYLSETKINVEIKYEEIVMERMIASSRSVIIVEDGQRILLEPGDSIIIKSTFDILLEDISSGNIEDPEDIKHRLKGESGLSSKEKQKLAVVTAKYLKDLGWSREKIAEYLAKFIEKKEKELATSKSKSSEEKINPEEEMIEKLKELNQEREDFESELSENGYKIEDGEWKKYDSEDNEYHVVTDNETSDYLSSRLDKINDLEKEIEEIQQIDAWEDFEKYTDEDDVPEEFESDLIHNIISPEELIGAPKGFEAEEGGEVALSAEEERLKEELYNELIKRDFLEPIEGFNIAS